MDKHQGGTPIERRAICREFVKKSIAEHLEAYSRWGLLHDEIGGFATASAEYEAGVISAFAELLERELIYRGPRPVFWSIKEQRILGQD